MYTIKIMNEFLHGAIWVYEEGTVSSWAKIDEDPVLSDLNRKTLELYGSYFKFDNDGESCSFDHQLEKDTKDEMLDLIKKILERLKELDDGSFVVEDYETARLAKL